MDAEERAAFIASLPGRKGHVQKHARGKPRVQGFFGKKKGATGNALPMASDRVRLKQPASSTTNPALSVAVAWENEEKNAQRKKVEKVRRISPSKTVTINNNQTSPATSPGVLHSPGQNFSEKPRSLSPKKQVEIAAKQAHSDLLGQLDDFESTSGSAAYGDFKPSEASESNHQARQHRVHFDNPLAGYQQQRPTSAASMDEGDPRHSLADGKHHGHHEGELRSVPRASAAMDAAAKSKMRKENDALRGQLKMATGIIQRAQRALSKSEGLVICTAVMREIMTDASLIIASREAEKSNARVIAAVGVDDILRRWSVEVDFMDRMKLEQELDHWKEDVDEEIHQHIEETCLQIVIDVVHDSVLHSELSQTSKELIETSTALDASRHKNAATTRLLEISKKNGLDTWMQLLIAEMTENAVNKSESDELLRQAEERHLSAKAEFEEQINALQRKAAEDAKAYAALKEQNETLTNHTDTLIKKAMVQYDEEAKERQGERDVIVTFCHRIVNQLADCAYNKVDGPKFEEEMRKQREKEDDDLVSLVEEQMTWKLAGQAAAFSVIDGAIHAAVTLADYKGDNPLITRRICQGIVDDVVGKALDICVAKDPWLFASDALETILSGAEALAEERKDQRLKDLSEKVRQSSGIIANLETQVERAQNSENEAQERMRVHARSRIRASAVQASQILKMERDLASQLADVIIDSACESAADAAMVHEMQQRVQDREAHMRFFWWKDAVRQDQHDDLMRKRFIMLENIYGATVKVSSAVMGMTADTDSALQKASDRLDKLSAKTRMLKDVFTIKRQMEDKRKHKAQAMMTALGVNTESRINKDELKKALNMNSRPNSRMSKGSPPLSPIGFSRTRSALGHQSSPRVSQPLGDITSSSKRATPNQIVDPMKTSASRVQIDESVKPHNLMKVNDAHRFLDEDSEVFDDDFLYQATVKAPGSSDAGKSGLLSRVRRKGNTNTTSSPRGISAGDPLASSMKKAKAPKLSNTWDAHADYASGY